MCDGVFKQTQLDLCLSRLNQRYPEAHVLLGAGAEHVASWVEKETGWVMCGNSSQVIAAVYDPQGFFTALAELDINYPEVCFARQPICENPNIDTMRWIYKQNYSCGGVGVSRNLQSCDDIHGYWQYEIEGIPISALFISDGKHHRCIGINEMKTLALRECHPYVYQGALANKNIEQKLYLKINSYIDKIINYFNLKGVQSLDMILQEGDSGPQLYVLEVNPRISASYELYERLNANLNLVDEHIRVCEGVADSIFTRPKLLLESSSSAYRIVYACNDGIVPRDVSWPPWCKDIPETGRLISTGDPICSIYADATEGDLVTLLYARERIIKNIFNNNL